MLELSQPVAAICYKTSDRAVISQQGKAAAAALLEQLPDVLGRFLAAVMHKRMTHDIDHCSAAKRTAVCEP